MSLIEGFSKWSAQTKRDYLSSFLDNKNHQIKIEDFSEISSHYPVLNELAENTLCQFPLPYGLAPNFLINEKFYTIPMAIEESSVVAAASKAAKFWSKRGGFRAQVLGDLKLGHVHFFWNGKAEDLYQIFEKEKTRLLQQLSCLEQRMKERGGGIVSLELIDHRQDLDDYYTLELKVKTCDAMGANFINTLLEDLAHLWKDRVENSLCPGKLQINMAILSNANPECLVRVECSCLLEKLNYSKSMTGLEFAQKFKGAIDIANANPLRATTHNKGIMNGIDAVALATGNDFRAIEAAAHLYAFRQGSYRSLSGVELDGKNFCFYLELPLALGTVGGLTSLHPLAKVSFELLGKPGAHELMGIIASVGLAQNFSAIGSLISTGIQKGHMKMHLLNIAKSYNATPQEIEILKNHFSDKTVSVTQVRETLNLIRAVH